MQQTTSTGRPHLSPTATAIDAETQAKRKGYQVLSETEDLHRKLDAIAIQYNFGNTEGALISALVLQEIDSPLMKIFSERLVAVIINHTETKLNVSFYNKLFEDSRKPKEDAEDARSNISSRSVSKKQK